MRRAAIAALGENTSALLSASQKQQTCRAGAGASAPENNDHMERKIVRTNASKTNWWTGQHSLDKQHNNDHIALHLERKRD